MLDLLVVLFAVLAICFGFVLLKGAPYLPTLRMQQVAALDMLNLRKGQTLLELGCGDGRILIAAAQRGYTVIGYELNPLLAAIAYVRTRRYKNQVSVYCGNFWNKDWPRADAIFTFLLPKYMESLDKKIIQYKHKPVKLASIAFLISGREHIHQQDGVYLYEYK